MKSNNKDLDVDIIGGLGPLTAEEEKLISEYIQAQKLKAAKTEIENTKSGSKATRKAQTK